MTNPIDEWVEIHFKENSIPSIIAGPLTEKSKAALTAYVEERVRDELYFFAQLDPEAITGSIDHFTACNVCLAPSHHCQCDQAVYAINALARKRIAELEKGTEE